MLLNIIKNNLFLQNIVANIFSRFPPVIEHNLAKYSAIKKAMYQTALEHTYGSYIEFGVFTGSSFNFAMKINKKLKYLGETDCEFIGFDSFQGFGNINKDDKHPFFNDDIFKINEEKVIKNIKKCSKGSRMRIVKGFFEDTIKNKTTMDFNIEKARVILIDCDLKEPTQYALNFIKPSLQEGTIILFDEYICFKGSKVKNSNTKVKKYNS